MSILKLLSKKKKEPKVIAVDFDGTLAVTKYPAILKPKKRMIRKIKKHRKNGDKIILWTCRSRQDLIDAIDWCWDNGIYFDAVNENLSDEIIKFKNDPRKIGADIYYDDKARRVR